MSIIADYTTSSIRMEFYSDQRIVIWLTRLCDHFLFRLSRSSTSNRIRSLHVNAASVYNAGYPGLFIFTGAFPPFFSLTLYPAPDLFVQWFNDLCTQVDLMTNSGTVKKITMWKGTAPNKKICIGFCVINTHYCDRAIKCKISIVGDFLSFRISLISHYYSAHSGA